MDVNGDGKLSKDEIQNGYLQYFGRSLNDQEVDDMFSKVDADNSGAIDYSEFVVATMNEKNLLSNNKLQTHSRCSIKMEVALSQLTKSSRFFPSDKTSTRR